MLWTIPLVAAVISLFLTFSFVGQWKRRRTSHAFWYGISLLMFTTAVFAEFYAYAFGWNAFIYKMYYFTAISLVAFMAVGTLYLVAPWRWVGHTFLAYASLVTLIFLVQMLSVQIDIDLLAGAEITVGGDAIVSDTVRGYSLWLSAVGGVILIMGALYSWWQTQFKGNLYIVGAALIMSTGGRLGKMGWTFLLPVAELIGVIVLYYGVTYLQKEKSNLTQSSEKIKITAQH